MKNLDESNGPMQREKRGGEQHKNNSEKSLGMQKIGDAKPAERLN